MREHTFRDAFQAQGSWWSECWCGWESEPWKARHEAVAELALHIREEREAATGCTRG